MINKKNIQQEVWRIIDNDMSIKKNILRNIINIRSLAQFLINTHKLNCSLDSVISAIRRYLDNSTIIGKENKIANLFVDSTIKTRNNILCLTLDKNAQLLEWFNLIKEKGKDTRVITGEHTTKVFLHNSLISLAESHFHKKDIINKNDNLSQISLTISEESNKTKGVLAKITGEIALNDINIEEIIVCPPEYVIYIKNKDLIKSHEVLYSIGLKKN